jgi:hypothetical protein
VASPDLLCKIEFYYLNVNMRSGGPYTSNLSIMKQIYASERILISDRV